MPLEVVTETPPEREVRRVGFMGAEFAVADKIGLMPLMRFAKIAKSGVDSADEDGLAAMYDLLQQCIADDPVYLHNGRIVPKERAVEIQASQAPDFKGAVTLGEVVTFGGWHAFETHADKTRADDEELMQVVKDVMAILSERPTRRPSDSSPGPQSTTPTSAEDSSALEVVQRLKSQGRPDLAMAVLRQQTG